MLIFITHVKDYYFVYKRATGIQSCRCSRVMSRSAVWSNVSLHDFIIVQTSPGVFTHKEMATASLGDKHVEDCHHICGLWLTKATLSGPCWRSWCMEYTCFPWNSRTFTFIFIWRSSSSCWIRAVSNVCASSLLISSYTFPEGRNSSTSISVFFIIQRSSSVNF